MNRYLTVCDQWTEVLERLADKQEFVRFLCFSAGMYKMAFSDTALVYQQNQNATMVTELKKWNQLGRLVNRGEHSIAVFGEDSVCRHYFDISQTNGKRVPSRWKMTGDLSDELIGVVNKKYNKSYINIQEAIAALSVDNIKIRLPEMQQIAENMALSQDEVAVYQQSLVSAVRFTVTKRCELGADTVLSSGVNLKAFDLFQDKRDLIRFCDLVQKCSKDTLLEIERELVQIIRKRREEKHELQTKPHRAVSSRNIIHNRPELIGNAENSDRQMGTDVAGVDTHRVSHGSDSIYHGKQVANHTEGNRQGSRAEVSGTGQAVPSELPPPHDISGNSDMGKISLTVDRTSDYGGNSVPVEIITVEYLIDRYNNADFNRRMDSYETAGWILSDAESTGYKLNPIEHFNSFLAEKFSNLQAEEIRNLIWTAHANKEKNIKIQSVLSIDYLIEKYRNADIFKTYFDNEAIAGKVFYEVQESEGKPNPLYYFNECYADELLPTRVIKIREIISNALKYGEHIKGDSIFEVNDEPVILNNEPVVTSGLPPLLNESLIFSILKYDDFLHVGKNEIAAYFKENQDFIKRTEFIKTVYSTDYTEFNLNITDKGYDRVGYKADENGLQMWVGNHSERTKESRFSWDLVQSFIADLIEQNNYLDKQESEYHFADPTEKPEQLSFFSEPIPAVEKKKANKKTTLPSFTITQEMVDYALKAGCDEPKSLLRIAAQYQKGKSDSDNAEFLKREFKESGRGFYYPNATKSLAFSVWYDRSGITFGAGGTAKNPDSNLKFAWEEASQRIKSLLEQGQFTTQDNLDKAAENELHDISAKLWYLHKDCNNDTEYFIPNEMFQGGFPDSTSLIASSLTNKENLQKYIDGLTEFIAEYEANCDILRFHFHKPKEILQSLKDLQTEHISFIANPDFSYQPAFFITEDEKEKLLLEGGNVQDSKFRIQDYFKEEHTDKEKSDFLKHEYGTGGSGRSGFNVSHDVKGIKYVKGSSDKPDAEILMKWNEAAHRIDKLVQADQYITQKDIEKRITHAKYVLENYDSSKEIDDYHIRQAKKVLARYGVVQEPKITVEDLILRAEEAGIPVEIIDSETQVAKVSESVEIARKPIIYTPETNQTPPAVIPKTGEAIDYQFRSDDIVQGGGKTKFKANVGAIQLLQQIESENRYATQEEQSILARYSGWGGIPQAFDSKNVDWSTEYNHLKNLLDETEYKNARASTLTSFYTPPEVTDGIFKALNQFGFSGGNILEPSMGVGNFFAKMPDDIKNNSKLYGVELDSISGRIAHQLHPNANIQINGFEKTNFNNNSFDVVIGNIPFGDFGVSDKAYDKHNFKIHDYFAAKAVDKVKPGGGIAIVTSKFTMDKQNEKVRRYLAERCDFLGAVRLPNTAFKQNAGTEITTDILFLKKRDTMTVEVPDWVHISETPDGIPCNQYFVDHPEMVLGKMAWDERMKGKYGEDSKATACIPDSEKSLAEQIQTAVSKIDGRIETVQFDNPKQEESDMIPADPSVRNFTHTLVDGQLYFRENEIMVKVQETGKNLDRMMGLHKIRQAAMAIIDAQAEGCSDKELLEVQLELNSVYDKFVKLYGYITDRVNERLFQQDDDYNTLAALEIVDTEKKTVEKSEIFSKRTIKTTVEITHVDTPEEALQVSLDRLGMLNVPYMAELAGCEPEKLIEDLGESVFRNPSKIHEAEPFSGYEDATEYLSGNVREKLKIAKQYSEHIDGGFQRNVSALEKVIPKDLEASEISVRIGTNWIDLEDYNRFLKEYAKADTGWFGHPVTRTRMGEYKIEGKYQDKSVAATEVYGTSRITSYHIFETLLNQRDVVIRDRKEVDGKVTYEVNTKETRLAREKARQMQDAFKSWIWEDIGRREKYVQKYNDTFNAIRGREYDGSYQSFSGINPAITLRPHQKNAILRAKLNGNTLLAHCVGAGKSFEMVAATMEKKRLGLINKSCIAVPKHLTLQTASEWIRLYPSAKLLIARPEDFEKNNRKKFIARCVTGDYDAVIMSFTQFERIPMSDEYRKQFIDNEIAELSAVIAETDADDRVSVKAIERQMMRAEERLEKLLNSPKDNSLCFEKLGFDYLVCDEAHNYKNCFVATKMSSVAGVQTTAAQKSEDMLMKTQYLNNKYGCNNILFATGTPVSNSMVELYIMQRYLRPDLLEKADVSSFDDWAAQFGEVVSQLEIKPAGDGFRMKNRFSKFVNIPELMQMYKEFADIQTPDMIKLPVPALKTGKPIVVTAKPDERQKAYMKELAARAEAIHNGRVDPSVDNMLRITHEARLLGLDSRCIFQSAESSPDSKVSKLLDNLMQNYTETSEQNGVQIVFCDIAINEDLEHFSVYEAIKADLIKRGIPRDEICFAGDAKTDKARAEMFAKLRKGEKRFILASTSKLGTGANIQDRICAIHHLDIPWKPSDLIQQDGRGVRQGNMFSEVGVYHYLTEETFDAYMMGIITNKAKFINQVMTSKDPVRVAEDVDEMVLNYSEMQAIASGNPLIKEKIQLDNDIATLKTLETEHKKSVFKMQELAERELPKRIESYAVLLEKASRDLKAYQEQHPDNVEFSITIGDTVFKERAEAGAEIEKALIKCTTTKESQNIGKYFGFDVSIDNNPAKDRAFASAGTPCVVSLRGNLTYTSEVWLQNAVGNVRRIENLAGLQINQKISELSSALDKAKFDLEEARQNFQKPFERADELSKKLSRIAYVNDKLSISNKDDPLPIDEPTVEKAADYVIAIPVPMLAGSMVHKDEISSPQLNRAKPKIKLR